MNTSGYLAFLLLGIVLIALDGQVLYHSGRRYLASAYREGTSAASVGRLVTTLFYLVMLGILALVSTVDFPVNGSLPELVTRIGVLLLILAAGHGITTWIMTNIRDRQETQRLSRKLDRHYGAGQTVTVDRSTSSVGSQGDTQTTIAAREPDRPIYTPVEQPYLASPDVNDGVIQAVNPGDER